MQLGGPYWKVKLGRRDSKTANMNAASKSLPSDTSTVSQLIKRFKSKGLSATDMVALSGIIIIFLYPFTCPREQ
jgi:peroxidase